MNIETNIASSAPTSIGTKIERPNEMNIEARIENAPGGTPTDTVMSTRTPPPDAMMDFSRRPGIATMHVGGMAE